MYFFCSSSLEQFVLMNGGLFARQARVDERVERARGIGRDHLGAEIVEDHQVAAEILLHALRGGLAVGAAALELCALERVERARGRLVGDGVARARDDTRDARRQVCLAQPRAALQQQVHRPGAERLRKRAADLKHALHLRPRALVVERQVEVLKRLVAVLQQATEVARELGVVAPQQAFARLPLHVARVMAVGAVVKIVGIIHRQVVRRQQLGALRLRVEVRALERAQLVRRVAAVAHRQTDERDHLLLQRLVERAQPGHAAVRIVHAAAVFALIFRAPLRDLLAARAR